MMKYPLKVLRYFRNNMACAFVFVDVDACVSGKTEGYICHLASLEPSKRRAGGGGAVLLAQPSTHCGLYLY